MKIEETCENCDWNDELCINRPCDSCSLLKRDSCFKQKQPETWVDPDTGLIWEKQGLEKRMSWKEALEYAETLGDNWRLPTIHELFSLIDFSRDNPASTSINSQPLNYWSSTTSVNNMNYAWYVYFYNGSVNYSDKSESYYVRCVKGDKNEKSDN